MITFYIQKINVADQLSFVLDLLISCTNCNKTCYRQVSGYKLSNIIISCEDCGENSTYNLLTSVKNILTHKWSYEKQIVDEIIEKFKKIEKSGMEGK